jgi:Putative adhesin
MTRTFQWTATAAALTFAIGLSAAPAARAAETRGFRQAFPAGKAELRLANLAGRVELVRGQGREVVVDATVHADAGGAAETQRLLQGMKWVKARDREGREEWALSYPVEKYRSYHYPRPGKDDSAPSFLGFLDPGHTSTTYRGEKVKIYSQKRSSAPTLYANLKIVLPADSNVVVRNVIGNVRGGDLEGTLTVDTGSGDVQIAAYSGHLIVDTGSGDVSLGSARGETSIDTGSGDVTVRRLIGNGLVDTGSGDVIVENVSAGKLSVDTGSGDVEVRKGTAARVLADTGSGNVRIVEVELEELQADTGSGDVLVRSSLAKARRVVADTGSGDIEIHAGPHASFDIESEQGSGELVVGYADASLRKSGRKVVGAKRGDGRTVIRVETGSGDCSISPKDQR